MNIILAALSIFSFYVVFGCAYRIVRWLLKAQRGKHWTATRGQIVESEIRMRPARYRAYDSAAKYFFRTQMLDLTRYFVRIVYRYEANEKQYRADKFDWSGEFTSVSQSEAERIHRAYAKDAIITVYYNLDNPAECVINRRTPEELKRQVLGGGIVAAFGLICLMLMIADSALLTSMFFGGLAAI